MTVLYAMYACALPESPSANMQIVRKRETSHRYCGRYLVSVLHLVCSGNYYVDEDKRSTEDTENKSLRDMEWMSQPSDYASEVEFPFRTRPVANSLTNKHFRRHTRSGAIVDECCIYKGCTISELTEYCQAR